MERPARQPGPSGAGTAANGTDWYYYKSGSPNTFQQTWAFAAGDQLRVSGFLGCRTGTGGGLRIAFTNLAAGAGATVEGSALAIHTIATNPAFHSHANEWTAFSASPFTAPTGTTSVALGKVAGLGADFDEISIYTIGDPVANDADAVDYGDFPADSPHFCCRRTTPWPGWTTCSPRSQRCRRPSRTA